MRAIYSLPKMNVGLDHERVHTHPLDRVRGERVSCGHDELIDLFDRRRLPQTDVVANSLPREVHLVELADFHDRPQRTMVLGEVQQLVVIPIASQPSLPLNRLAHSFAARR